MNGARGRTSAIVLPILGAVLAVAAWWGITRLFHIRTFFLPAPPDIVTAFRLQPSFLFSEAWQTLEATLIGFLIATVAGLTIAVALAASRIIERSTLPLIVALNAVPKVAVAPLLVVWLGFGMQPKIVLVALISFFPIVVSTMAGLISTPTDLGELSRSLTASWGQTYVKFRLPWALPQIFTGLKVGISLAVVGAVVAEIASPQHGLGAVILLSGQNLDTPLAFAAITLLALISVALFYLVVGVERLLLPWAKEIAQ
jgi:NitT/TauT family transport system permease protein